MAGQEPERTMPYPRDGARRPSRAVYRRRRLIAAVLAVLVVLALIGGGFAIAGMLAGGGNASADTAGSTRTPDPAGTAGPSATTDPDEGSTRKSSSTPETSPTTDSSSAKAECDESKIVVESGTDSAVYPAGENPVLTLTVTNEGKAPCAVNVGTTEMEFVLTHGEERVFSSADCQAEAADLVKVIDAGKSEQAKFTWKRNETRPGCKATKSKPEPGTYALTARLGERAGDKAVFELK